MIVIKATLENLKQIVPLFDQYRVFYKQASDLKSAEIFLRERFQNKDSLIFIALSEGVPVGFTQLYFTFSSVSLKPTLILNDLFVHPDYRGQGFGALLLKSAQQFCAEHEFKGLALETAVDNPARRLYEKMGWEKDSHCFHYFWSAQ
ncbi:GNAT family N-acetyltransferase [Maribacter aurantiacus]|uniref:GNAT family N-acetyltransferase n=1 Tax=Maribacter aurantiacus TaxID=1882343 RepID=A0A5R8M369_9FLAO|nr:GNAT family N-acetyltransferase [Maribacter aurantiacus]TLF44023.1 GNAT family N-acetyltransferase [Maribacter aurantiacus]